MAFKQWDSGEIAKADGKHVSAIHPVILSVSRATDIPAFYADWFFGRIKDGYFKWLNPFNANQVQYVAIDQTRVIVFWTKNPAPLLPYLDQLDRVGIHYYFQYTLNDYENEGYEPHVPLISERVETFRSLSKMIGRDRLVWRLDPLLLADGVGVKELLEKGANIASLIGAYTKKLVFSFADLAPYSTVRNNLKRAGINSREFSIDEMLEIAKGLKIVANEYGLEVATCAEAIELKQLGITHNRCVDDELMIRLWSGDGKLMNFLGYEGKSLFGESDRPYLKDKGQRKECGCIISKDIGRYRTCPHLCVYCYANSSQSEVMRNFDEHDSNGESLTRGLD